MGRGMSRKSKVNKQNINRKLASRDNEFTEKVIKSLYKIILLATLFVVFYPPYLRGLFFESEYIRAELLVFIVFALFWVYKLLRKEKLVFETPLEYASLGFVIVYLISIFAAVSVNAAKGEWLKYCMYFAVFFIISDFAKDYKNRIRVLWVIIASAVGVCILGIDAVAGGKVVDFINNFLNRIYLAFGLDIPEKGTFFALFVDGRITSTLQYPNTLAAYLIVAFIVAAALILLTDSRIKKLIAACAGAVFFITFVFTISRGAYLVLPFVLILFVVVLPKGQRIKGVIYLITPIIASIPAVIRISSISRANHDGNTGIWMWMFSGIVFSLILILISDFVVGFFEKINWKIYVLVLSTITVVTGIGLVLMLSLNEPLTIVLPVDSKVETATIARNISLEPNRQYRISFDVQSTNSVMTDTKYSVGIYSKNENDILFNNYKNLASINEVNKAEQKSILKDFEVPPDSKVIYIYFTNMTKGANITFSNCIITDVITGKNVINVPLKYKYIPEALVNRFQDLEVAHSNLIRMVFYQDGLKIFRDYWYIGAGGGAWSLLYFAYQSFFYFTTQAHNYYLQLAVETGIIGLLIQVFLIFSIIYIYIKQRYKSKTDNSNLLIMQAALFSTLVAMFFHAAIDFDFSFPSILLLMWEILAVYNAGIKEAVIPTGSTRIIKVKELKISSAFGILLSLVLIAMTSTIVASMNHNNKGTAAIKQNQLDLSIQHFEKAAELNPTRPEYKINYSNLILNKGKNASPDQLAKAEKWISEAEKQSKYDVSILPYIVKYYFAAGNIQKGIDLSEKIIGLRPFREEEWEQLVNAYDSVIRFYLQNNNNEKSQDIANRALKAISWAADVNESNRKPFIFNASTSQVLERLAFYLDGVDTGNNIDLDSIIFYNLPEMDIDSNGIPDQWNSIDTGKYKLGIENNMLKVDKITDDKNSYIESRPLLLKPNTKYSIEMELNDSNGIEEINFLLTGVSDETRVLKLKNNIYSSTVEISDKLNTAYLRVFIKDNCLIKSLKITEIK